MKHIAALAFAVALIPALLLGFLCDVARFLWGFLTIERSDK